VCLPGLHITLGVFLRLFILLEDECHTLDLQLAASAAPEVGDRVAFVDYSVAIRMERMLLDEKSNVEQDTQWLSQTISLLSLTAADPSRDPQVTAIADLIKSNKDRLSGIVSNNTNVPAQLQLMSTQRQVN
jgi:hypothetical protein